MRTLLAVLSVSLGWLPAQPVLTPPPTPEELARTRPAVIAALREALVDAAGNAAVQRLLDAARRATSPTAAFALQLEAMHATEQLGDLQAAREILRGAYARTGTYPFEQEMGLVGRFGDAQRAPAPALVAAYLDAARATVEDSARRGAAVGAARAVATRAGDAVLLQHVERGARDLAALARAIPEATATDDQGPARGRLLCYYLEDWQRGLGMLAADPAAPRAAQLEHQAGTPDDARRCMEIADSWRAEAARHELPLVRRNLLRHALAWYQRAWLQAEGLERARVARQMDAVTDALLADNALGRVTFAQPEHLGELVCTGGGQWQITDGELRGLSSGRRMRATYRFAYQRIRSVTLRGGIRSADNLNFRLAVGPLNVLFNWEVRPENHFYLGDRSTATQTPALVRGQEHVVRVRQLGASIVVFLDGEPVFEGAGDLAGTVCVYPALGSEIFVSEIAVDGEIDGMTVVDGPIGTTR